MKNEDIVLWAGAIGTQEDNIRQAAFKVTQQGFVYANQGYFSGTIESAEIKTAKITGTGEGDYGLII
jgi:hypothetical protein